MKNSTLALVGKKRFEIIEDEIKKIKKDHVLIKVCSTGICGSDLHYYREGGLGSRNNMFPLFLGHETSGIVVERNNVYGVKNYSSYAIDPLSFDEKCMHKDFDKLGKCGFKANLCPHSFYLGANTKGSFRNYLEVHKSQLIKLNSFIDDKYGFLVEPASISLYSILRAQLNIKKKNTILIMGGGAIGMLQSQILNKVYNADVSVIDKIKHRREVCIKKFGAKNAYSSVEELIKNSDTKFDYIIDNIFSSKIVNKSLTTIKSNGKYIIVGIPETDFILINPHIPRIKEIDFINIRRSNLDFQYVIDLLINYKINYKDLLTHEFTLQDHKKAFRIASNYKDNVIRASIF